MIVYQSLRQHIRHQKPALERGGGRERKKNKPELLPRATTPVATLSSLHEDQQHKAIALQLSDEQKIDQLDFTEQGCTSRLLSRVY